MKDTYKVPKKLRDKLQAAVDYLTEHPWKIEDVWFAPYDTDHGCLFRRVHPAISLKSNFRTRNGRHCGCLTQIRNETTRCFQAYTKRLTGEIKADERLPSRGFDITVDHLPIFMEWMLRLAVEFRWKS